MVNNQQIQNSIPNPPKQGAVFQSYIDFVHSMPLRQTSQAALTPRGFLDDEGHLDPPVDNSVDMPFDEAMKQYDMGSYNTKNPQYFKTLRQIYENLPSFNDPAQVDQYIQSRFKGSPLKAQMILDASSASQTPPKLLSSIAQYESAYGTKVRAGTFNATGFGQLDNGKSRVYKDFQDNLNHTAANFALRRNDTTSQPASKTEERPLAGKNP